VLVLPALLVSPHIADKLFEEKLTADVEEHKAGEEDNERMSKGWQSFVTSQAKSVNSKE
jgi:hypothetical protein